MRPKKHNPLGYRSGLEEKVGKLCEENGLHVKYEADSLAFTSPAQKRRYTPDWKVADNCYIETKGLFTAADRKKMLLVLEQNPLVSILMVFQRNNKLTRVSKTTYGDWCDKHSIKWCLFSDSRVWLQFIKDNQI